MHDQRTIDRFIELRVQGWSFNRIARELGVSKPTLIDWSHKHQFTIQNLHAIEREQWREQFLQPQAERIRWLGAQLQRAEAELAKRDTASLSTPQLQRFVFALRAQIAREAGTMIFGIASDKIPHEDYSEQIQSWTP